MLNVRDASCSIPLSSSTRIGLGEKQTMAVRVVGRVRQRNEQLRRVHWRLGIHAQYECDTVDSAFRRSIQTKDGELTRTRSHSPATGGD